MGDEVKDQPLPAIIDIEASGFGSNSYPIEVGVILPNRSTCCYIIKPCTEWDFWDPEAERVHCISRELLLQHGASPESVAIELNLLLKGQTVYSDAWGHDSSWLGKLYHAVSLPMLFRMESIRYLMSEQQSELWHDTKAEVERELQLPRHRASSDARVIQETFRQTFDREGLQATPRKKQRMASG